MEFITKYTPKHYKSYVSVADKIVDKHTDLHKWVKSLGIKDILIWLKSIAHLENNSLGFFEESSIVITLVIRLFCLELDIESAQLTNKEITKLIQRVKYSLRTELAYRKDTLEKTPVFSILKDMED